MSPQYPTFADVVCPGIGRVHAEQVAATAPSTSIVVQVEKASAGGTLALDFAPCAVSLKGAVSVQARLVSIAGSTIQLAVVPKAAPPGVASAPAKILLTDVVASGCEALLPQLDGELPLQAVCASSTLAAVRVGGPTSAPAAASSIALAPSWQSQPQLPHQLPHQPAHQPAPTTSTAGSAALAALLGVNIGGMGFGASAVLLLLLGCCASTLSYSLCHGRAGTHRRAGSKAKGRMQRLPQEEDDDEEEEEDGGGGGGGGGFDEEEEEEEDPSIRSEAAGRIAVQVSGLIDRLTPSGTVERQRLSASVRNELARGASPAMVLDKLKASSQPPLPPAAPPPPTPTPKATPTKSTASSQQRGKGSRCGAAPTGAAPAPPPAAAPPVAPLQPPPDAPPPPRTTPKKGKGGGGAKGSGGGGGRGGASDEQMVTQLGDVIMGGEQSQSHAHTHTRARTHTRILHSSQCRPCIQCTALRRGTAACAATGEHWERRRQRANAAFEQLKAVSDPQDTVQPWDSISNVVPQSVVTITSCAPPRPTEPPRTRGGPPPPRLVHAGGARGRDNRCAAVLE